MSRTPEQAEALDREHMWVPGEKCRRKGTGAMNVYFVADTSETGALLQVIKGGKRLGAGRWHSWKNMEMDFIPSAKKLGKTTWYGAGTEEAKK